MKRALQLQQKSDYPRALRLKDLYVGHCLEITSGAWLWCVDMDIYPYVEEDVLRLTLKSSRVINPRGRLQLGTSFWSFDYSEGSLYHTYSDWSEEATVDVVDGQSRTLPPQWWAYCPSCDKRYPKAWISQGYADRKEPYPRPPDLCGADVIECSKCNAHTPYRQWSLKSAPRKVVAGSEKWLIAK